MRVRIWIVLLAVLAACAPASSTPAIRLSELDPLPASTPGAVRPLRVAIAAVISPRGTVHSYQAFLDYLSDKLDRPVELIQRRTYAEVNEVIKSGDVDVGFVCTSAYVAGHDEFGMELIAAPVVDGAAVYYSLLLVPADSPAAAIADLRGKVFAFTDPMSNSGRIYPTYLVQELGTTPDEFFARTFFTYSHDDAIHAVADGLAEGAAVDSLVYDYAVARDPSLAGRVKVIHRSPPFGIPPVVVGPGVRPQLRAELQELLLAMEADERGQVVLRDMGIDRFAMIDDAAYDSVRALLAAVGPLLR